ncbi:MAG: AAA family ATPase [Clostridiales bacterium]|nr:AAA family ATPase [Clostridiales bacterium]
MKKRRNHTWFLIVLLALVLLLGGTGIITLIYYGIAGTLVPYLETFFIYITYSYNSALIVFWGFALPILLIVFLIFTVARGRKINKVTWTLEDGLKQAIDAERADFVAHQNQTLPSRFSPLTQGKTVAEGKEVSSLSQLCADFRNFAADKLKLYFSEQDVRKFVASLGASHMLILTGVSGSGKTSLAYAFGEFVNNSSTIIPVQPMWKERADLLGYYNEFTKHFNETTLFRKIYEANFGDRMYITVLDEMNIARIEYYFAEFLSLMELPNPELRYLEAASDAWANDPEGIVNGCLKLPESMWFVGTVNDDDSAYPISDKVYDRAMIVDLGGKAQPFEVEESATVALSYTKFQEMVAQAIKDYRPGAQFQADITAFDAFLTDKFQMTYGNRIRRQIGDYVAVYVACGGSELEAIDDILAKKVLRKLEYRDLSRLRGEIDQLKSFIVNTFGEDSQCRRYLDSITSD